MSAAVRCLAVVLVGWAGARAATVGAFPLAELFDLRPSEARTAGQGTTFPALEPAVPLESRWGDLSLAPPAPAAAPAVRPFAIPFYVPVYRTAAYSEPRRGIPVYPASYPPVPDLRDWPASQFAGAPLPPSTVAASEVSVAAVPRPTPAPKFDRLQLTSWAMLRSKQGIGAAPRSLASGGTLGGSQAGARLAYRFSPALAASLRTTSTVGTSQSEVAAGLRLTPMPSIPVAITFERRQAVGDYGGRSAFALFAEGGLYGKPLWGLDIESYAQAGIVGVRDRAAFADAAFALTRPVYRQVSAGFGAWGGVQPGLYRVDAGPRVTYRVRPNVKMHVDWRQRLAGSAAPGSGPAVTLAGDF